MREKLHRSSLDLLGKLSCKMQAASIPRSLYFQITRGSAGPVGVWFSLDMSPESESPPWSSGA